MILKRLSEGFRKQDWFVVVVEIITVVIGLFIGLQVDDWNQDRKDVQELERYYDRLIEDINNDILQIDSVTAYYQQVRTHGARVLARFEEDPSTWDKELLIDLYQASQLNTPTFSRSTFDEMTATGFMVKIPSIEARRELAFYYATFEANEEINLTNSTYRTQIRAGYSIRLREQILDSCRDRVEYISGQSPLYSLPEVCAAQLDEALIENQLKWVKDQEDIKENLQLHMNYVDIFMEQQHYNKVTALTTIERFEQLQSQH